MGRANGTALISRDLLQQHGIRLRCVGRREMLPLDLQKAIGQMEDLTKGHTQYVSLLRTSKAVDKMTLAYIETKLTCSGVLNVCCPYTSRDEITRAVQSALGRETDPQSYVTSQLAPHPTSRLSSRQQAIPEASDFDRALPAIDCQFGPSPPLLCPFSGSYSVPMPRSSLSYTQPLPPR